jgi:hypothetical protein
MGVLTQHLERFSKISKGFSQQIAFIVLKMIINTVDVWSNIDLSVKYCMGTCMRERELMLTLLVLSVCRQLHEKCQVLMRKYDRESRANKRLSMDYEQVVWRMSQSADFTLEGGRQLSVSPGKGDSTHGSPSPVRRSLSSTPEGSHNGVTRRQRRISGGDEDRKEDRALRTRSGTFSLDKEKIKGSLGDAVNGTDAPPKDLADMIIAASTASAPHDESFSSGQDSGDTSDFHSMESSVILETPKGVSYNITMSEGGGGGGGGDNNGPSSLQDEVFMEGMELDGEVMNNLNSEAKQSSGFSKTSASAADGEIGKQSEASQVMVTVNSPTSE